MLTTCLGAERRRVSVSPAAGRLPHREQTGLTSIAGNRRAEGADNKGYGCAPSRFSQRFHAVPARKKPMNGTGKAVVGAKFLHVQIKRQGADADSLLSGDSVSAEWSRRVRQSLYIARDPREQFSRTA
jgi:hypothetical protein